MSNSNKKSALSHLIVIMTHVIKWYSQPEKQSKSWRDSIKNSRTDIEKIQKEQPSINRKFFEDNWDKTTEKAIKQAEHEMRKPPEKRQLTWDEVFVNKYTISAIVILLILTVFIVI